MLNKVERAPFASKNVTSKVCLTIVCTGLLTLICTGTGMLKTVPKENSLNFEGENGWIQHTFYILPLHILPISLFRRYFSSDPQSLGVSRICLKRSGFPRNYRILTETLGFHPKFNRISPKCLGIGPKHPFQRITLLSMFGHFLYLAIFFPRPPRRNIESVL